MLPSEPRRSKSRRSSILKPCKPRQPLQTVNFNSSSNESSPTTSKKRRVSFAEKKHVKEFCHSTEQGTVWDNTYEEQDFSCKGSASDQNIGTELKQNTSECTPQDYYTHLTTERVHCPNEFIVVNNESYALNIEVNDEDNNIEVNDDDNNIEVNDEDNNIVVNDEDNNIEVNDKDNNIEYSLDFTNPVEVLKVSNDNPQPEQIALPNTNTAMVSSNIIVYEDSNDNGRINNINETCCSERHSDCVVNSQSDKICAQDLSMEFTTSISTCLRTEQDEHKNVQEDNDALHRNDLDMDCTINCNDISMEITRLIPVSVIATTYNSESLYQAPITAAQNCSNVKHDVTENSAMLTANLQLVERTVSEQMQNTNCNNDSTGLMSIQSFTVGVDTHHRNDNEEDTAFDTSMKITTAAPFTTYEENIGLRTSSFSGNESPINRNDLRRDHIISEGIDKTECFDNVLMEMTKPINSTLSSNIVDQDNPKTNKSIHTDDGTMFFDNISMEMTNTMTTNNKCKISDPQNSELLFQEITEEDRAKNINICTNANNCNKACDVTKNVNNSICFKEETKLLQKSMDITEAITVPLCHEKTFNNITRSIEALSSQIAPITCSFAVNSVQSMSQIDIVSNNSKTIPDIPMEITTAIPSTFHFSRNVTINETENLIISTGNMSQYETTSNTTGLTQAEKSITKSVDFAIPMEIAETANMHELHNTHVMPSTDNFDESLSVILQKDMNRKGTSREDENINPRESSSFVKCQSSERDDVHLSPKSNDDHISKIFPSNDCIHVENTINHMRISKSGSSPRNSSNEIKECNFLEEHVSFLEDNSMDLQSVQPPSFICRDSEEEDDDVFLHTSSQYKLPISEINNVVNATSNNDQMNDPNRSESLNIEDNHIKNYCRSIIVNNFKDDQKADYEVVARTVNSNEINKTNEYITNVGSFIEENIQFINDVNHENIVIVPDTSRLKETEIINRSNEFQVINRSNEDQEKCYPENFNVQINIENIEQKEQYIEVEKMLETEQNIDCFNKTEVIDSDEVCQEQHYTEDLNEFNETNLEDVEQGQQCSNLENRLQTECSDKIENESLVEQDPFVLLLQKLETQAERENCIWNIHQKCADRRIIVFGFISNSLLIATILSHDLNYSEENLIKETKIISRIADDADVLIRIVHDLILEKISTELLTHLYRTHEDIIPMLDFISQDVKLAMDFMFELRRLDDSNLMEIARNKISFISRSKRMGIILKVTIDVKSFDKLTSNDISVCCLLGMIREKDIKNLVTNVKRNHKFLRRYMNDVRDYIDIIEETSKH